MMAKETNLLRLHLEASGIPNSVEYLGCKYRDLIYIFTIYIEVSRMIEYTCNHSSENMKHVDSLSSLSSQPSLLGVIDSRERCCLKD